MVQEQKKELRVGLFVFLGGVLALIMAVSIGSEKQMFQRSYTLYAHFDSTSGLRVGAPVQLAGIKAGIVKAVSLSDDEVVKKIAVTLKVNKAFQSRIRADSEASIITQGLLGDKFIYLSIGTKAAPILSGGDTIKSVESVSFNVLLSQANSFVGDLSAISKSLRALVDDPETQEAGDIKVALHSLRNILEEIEQGEGAIHALIYDTKGKDAVADLASSLASLKAISDSVDSGEGTIGKLVRDPAIYNDIRSMLGKANRNKLLRSVIRSTLRQNERQIESQQ